MLIVGEIPQSSLPKILEYTPNVAAGLSRVSQEKESQVEVLSFYDLALEITVPHSCCHLLYFAMESPDAGRDRHQANKCTKCKRVLKITRGKKNKQEKTRG